MRVIRGKITASSRAEGKLRRFDASGVSGETIKNRELLQHVGFSSAIVDGAHCLMIEYMGAIFCLATENPELVPDQPSGSPWDVAIYKDKTHYIQLLKNGDIVVKGEKVILDAAAIELGSGGTIRKLIDDRFVDIYNAHTHAVSGVATLVPNVLLGDTLPAVPVSTSITKAR